MICAELLRDSLHKTKGLFNLSLLLQPNTGQSPVIRWLLPQTRCDHRIDGNGERDLIDC